MKASSNRYSNEDGGPWYKQFWAWFIFAPLIIVVIMSSVMVTLAFKHKQDIVVDDYYKVGKMINQEFAPEDRARELGIFAKFTVEPQADEFTPALISVSLSDSKWAPQDSLLLQLSHPIEAEKDHFITLLRADNLTWRAKMKSELAERWYLRLSSIDDAGSEIWRVQGEIEFPDSLSAQLQ